MKGKEEIEKIAFLSRLTLEENEMIKLSEEMQNILGYFDKISQINTEGVEPLVSPTPLELQANRADQPEVSVTPEEALSNAPSRLGQLFKVPPVV